ncbi:uncharacterized protein LOC111461506 isoform X1 [Cucurbita moschata]|uniref:Uncharacterized protein LOC111461506 isoform X1 n=1 Tax=Cucurbita moschata TaxID=3662 RepID=A0A6J1HA27_CUCMO|nr:uncharacterized protein LOC111461506 isoform X1 [Cucurbita moschata]
MNALCWNHPTISLKGSKIFENYGFIRLESMPHFHHVAALKISNSELKPSPLKVENRMFILGMGFVGRFFAQELKKLGWAVSGTCRNLGQKMELEERGFDVHIFDANNPEPGALKAMKYHTHLLVSIPPDVDVGDPLLQHEKLLRASLQGGDLQWLCYLSSTSVYGDHGGDWVDEDNPTNPSSQTGKSRIKAEEQWLNFGNDLGLSAHVFRLGGIYGPGRSAIDTLIKQKSLSERQQRRGRRQYTSRVHVLDICQALKACIQKPSSRRVYNIVDDDPSPREEVFSYARDLVMKKWPGKIEQLSEKMEASVIKNGSGRGEKRVCNVRMKRELGVSLVFSSYKSGLQNIIDQMGDDEPF